MNLHLHINGIAHFLDLDARAVHSPVQFLAGGTNVIDLMKLGVMTPERLVDVSRWSRATFVDRIRWHRTEARGVRAYGRCRHHPMIRREYPVIAQWLWMAASPQLRNMATLGGNAGCPRLYQRIVEP
ncbi:FAD binding domain-containing protein [Caballeronia sp. RCC_10]|jgi:xanthine dehydrogenase YagS FAD-binding subunit|uniref:FAD binding domain-containing protein n=1 Tax=Caballeronia sp. RCC_10 TaxID=3239227 RepID=UPI0035266CE7